ncbi:MAG TPA: hypothetical protein VFQ45_09770 [Longimicrobium sp.]|nr:hypothetical protein [Longimicrobium sp.]
MSENPASVVGECPHCRAPIRADHPYAWCAECGQALPQEIRDRTAAPRAGSPPPPPEARTGERVEFRYFRGTLATWGDLFAQAAEFATRVGRENLVGISHSADHDDGVVTVWYWVDA